MTSLLLTLRQSPAAVHEPAAWFIPGADIAACLEEIAAWEIPTASLRLCIVPTSAGDRTPAGVLVPAPDGAQPARVLRALPYGRVAGRLYLPADAILYPPVTDRELQKKLVLDVYVFHPTIGLVGFGDADLRGVADLLSPPARRATAWNRARPGHHVAGRLLAVEPEPSPGLDEILESSRGDIGTMSPQGLPTQSGDSMRTAGDWLKITRSAMASGAASLPLKLLSWLTGAGAGPAGASTLAGAMSNAAPRKRGWLDSLHQWLMRHSDSMSDALQSARLRELERLKNLLEKNPDEGLRFAIPLRDTPMRGIAEPGAELGRHDVNFNLADFNSKAAPHDRWTVPPDFLQNLRERYRAAANRELNLGRYRRAAYIFANLLGDFAAAANALEQGRFYREAAIIHRDHLSNKTGCAECLERGGLLPEAIAAYKELLRWEKAGDLCAIIGRKEEAAECYRAQIAAHRQSLNWIESARILEMKLHAPDEALALLTRAWLDADFSGKCLVEAFQLLARHSRHEETLALIRRLHGMLFSTPQGAAFTTIVGNVATTYPDAAVRTACADTTRVLAGELLRKVDSTERAKLARVLTPLAPHDRLLSRDVERFINPPPRKRPPGRNSARQKGPAVAVVRQFNLPGETLWKAVAGDGNCFYAIGVRSRSVIILRGTWDGRTQEGTWGSDLNTSSGGSVSLHPRPGWSKVTVFPGVQANQWGVLPVTDAFPAAAVFENPPWVDKGVLRAMAHRDGNITWALRDDSLCSYRSGSGVLLATYELSFLIEGEVKIAATADGVCAAMGTMLLSFDPQHGFHNVEPMPGPVRQLVAGPSSLGTPLVIALEEGVNFRMGVGNQNLAEDISDPLAAITACGMLVVANSREGRVWRISEDRLRAIASFQIAGNRPMIALMATGRRNQFATFSADGTVTLYDCSA